VIPRVLLGLAYPFIVLAALTLSDARGAALLAAAALALGTIAKRRQLDRAHLGRLLPGLGLVGAVLVLAATFNEARFFLFVPTLINAALLVAFARTLGSGPSMVETLARWQGYEISGEKIRYCHAVTAGWCLFFALNGGVILWLALYAPLARWALYTGLVAYVLVGMLLVAELLYRAWRFRDYRDRFPDSVLRRVFPPRDLAA
jgi:uncharacterized membrane protein